MSTPFHSRDDWGARPRPLSARINNEGQTLHYGGASPWGASADRSSPERFAATTDHARCATILRAWQAFHVEGRGWADLAYSSAVCPHGHRYEGRGPDRRSAANGTNAGNTRSCATVYIAGGDDPVTDGAKRAFHDEAQRFGVALRWNHADWKATSCAGDPIRAWQAAGFPLPATPTPTPSPTPEDDDMVIIRHPKGPAVAVSGGTLMGIKSAETLANFERAGIPVVAVDDATWQDFHRVDKGR